jgi:hypothetical protein
VGVGRRVLDELERKDQKVLVGLESYKTQFRVGTSDRIGWLFGLALSLFGYTMIFLIVFSKAPHHVLMFIILFYDVTLYVV